MLGGEFKSHGAQVGVDLLNVDPANPATRHLPTRASSWPVKEIYLFKNYDAGRVHELLVLDKHPNDRTPGRYPIAWTRDYGKGRVFYTTLGHRKRPLGHRSAAKRSKESGRYGRGVPCPHSGRDHMGTRR